MHSNRIPWLVLSIALLGGLALGVAAVQAEEPPTAAPAAQPSAPPATAPATEARNPGSFSPMFSMMSWVAEQVAGDAPVACPCPTTTEGQALWRSWYSGGANVPLASLRDRLVADGWTADRFVSFFKKMKAGKGAGGDCASKCDGKCDGKSDGAPTTSGSASDAAALGEAPASEGGCKCKCKAGKKAAKPEVTPSDAS